MTDLSPETGSPVERVSLPRLLAAYGSLLLLACVVFAPTLTHEFVWDDHEQIRDNELIRDWSNLPEFWKKDVLALSRKGGIFRSNYYRPLVYSQFLLYYQWFELNTKAWHALAILHHFFASAAVLFFLRRLGFVLAVAWPAALLFVVHPVHGESVSWIAAAFNDPPAATLLLLGLSAYAMWAIKGRWFMLLLAVIGYAGGLCMKESGLSMLLLAPLVHWYVSPRSTPRSWPVRAAVGMACLALLTVGYFALRGYLFDHPFGNYEGTKRVGELMPTFPALALYYLRFLVWPFGFSPSYPLRYITTIGDPWAWGGLVALIVLTVVIWVATRRSRPLRFAAFWTAFCIWPVFNIRSFREEYLVHQRYLYLACMSVCLAIAWLAWRWVKSGTARGVVIGGVVALWSVSNLMYNPAWKSDHNLWARVTEVDAGNTAGLDWLAHEANQKGDYETANAYIDRSIAVNPNSPHPYIIRASNLATRQGRPAEALTWYAKGIELHWKEPRRDPVAIGAAQRGYAKALLDLGRRDEAIAAYVASTKLPPYPADAALDAALVLLQAGRGPEAFDILESAIEHNADHRELIYRTIYVAAQLGNQANALKWSNVYIQRFPQDPQTPELQRRVRAAGGGG